MANNTFWFGNAWRMAWVPCPSINAGLSSQKWIATSDYLNGGASQRSSMTGHKTYSFAWAPQSQEDAYSVIDYFDGVYGEGPFYFVDPFAASTNVLPAWLATPSMGGYDAPNFLIDSAPDLINTPDNSLNYPSQSARYDLFGQTTRTFRFRVPEGYEAHIGAHGSATGSAYISIIAESSSVDLTLLSVTDPIRTNHIVTLQPDFVIEVGGTGLLTLSGLIVQMLPAGSTVPSGGFISGRGNSGVRLASDPVVTGYSAALTNASVGVTVDLVETGAWD